jgi:hypothetical protein
VSKAVFYYTGRPKYRAQEVNMIRPQDGRPRLQHDRGILIGSWFIERGPDRRPLSAGRIVRGIRAGVYVLAYVWQAPGIVALQTATPEQMVDHGFELWAHEQNWTDAFAGARAPGVTHGPVS